MSYGRTLNYTIIPAESFKIIRNCAGCGEKKQFCNTNRFRVNANGNSIDVWLIYQCTTCKHTYNLSICDRQKKDTITAEDYQRFQNNCSETALRYGTDKQLFSQNRAEIDWSQQPYVFLDDNGLASAEDECFKKGDRIIIHNAGGLKVRTDRIISDLLKMTRNKLKRMRDSGEIIVTEDKQKAWMEIRLEVEVVD